MTTENRLWETEGWPQEGGKPIQGSFLSWQPLWTSTTWSCSSFWGTYKMCLRIGHSGDTKVGRHFSWASVTQWLRVALESLTAWFPGCACLRACWFHGNWVQKQELPVQAQSQVLSGCIYTSLIEAYAGLGTSDSFWNERWRGEDKSDAQKAPRHIDRLEWECEMGVSDVTIPSSVQSSAVPSSMWSVREIEVSLAEFRY